MNVEVFLSGLFFLLIIIILFISDQFGHETFSDLNSERKLQKVEEDPKKFKISVALLLLEHSCIISLAITLFLAFNQYNILLGIIWLVSRIIEGAIQIYNKRSFWRLIDIAKEYSASSSSKKEESINLGHEILKKKNLIFAISQILFFIGTLAYSLVFIMYEVIPVFIGWFGVIASVIYGIGNVIFLIKPTSKIIWSLGGLLIFVFEAILGGCLIFISFL
ncbi:MAG: DUF4386 family protein [Promethearchaeota archaeon]|nr:MAG: DUF4386 family protein [Candidatus Lokiarchaeota archaeon]